MKRGLFNDVFIINEFLRGDLDMILWNVSSRVLEYNVTSTQIQTSDETNNNFGPNTNTNNIRFQNHNKYEYKYKYYSNSTQICLKMLWDKQVKVQKNCKIW